MNIKNSDVNGDYEAGYNVGYDSYPEKNQKAYYGSAAFKDGWYDGYIDAQWGKPRKTEFAART